MTRMRVLRCQRRRPRSHRRLDGGRLPPLSTASLGRSTLGAAACKYAAISTLTVLGLSGLSTGFDEARNSSARRWRRADRKVLKVGGLASLANRLDPIVEERHYCKREEERDYTLRLTKVGPDLRPVLA